MQPLAKRLRAARANSGTYPISAIELLLTEAAAEIERLQRIAYRQSSEYPEGFKSIQQIRKRHARDDEATDLDGLALQAHLDRADLLAVITFISQERRKGGADVLAWTGKFERLPEEVQSLMRAEDR